MNEKFLFLDMDEVLVDFVGAVIQLYDPKKQKKDLKWDLASQFGFEGESVKDFWAPMGFTFWSSLDWTVEGKEILKLVEEIFGENIVLMTSPCRTPGCVEGKVSWINKHLPRYDRRFFIGPPKHTAAGCGKILIDDNDTNVGKFVDHGGKAILFPRPWNAASTELDENGELDLNKYLPWLEAELLAL